MIDIVNLVVWVVWWQPKSHGRENCVSFKKIILILEVTKHKELSGIVQTIDDHARCYPKVKKLVHSNIFHSPFPETQFFKIQKGRYYNKRMRRIA